MSSISIDTYHHVSEFHLPEPPLSDYEQLQGQEKFAATMFDALCQLDQAMVSLCHQQVENMRMAQRVLADDLKSHDDSIKRKAAATVMRTCNLKSTNSVVSTLKADYRTLYETFKATRLTLEVQQPELLQPLKPKTYTKPSELPPNTLLPHDNLPYQMRLHAYQGRFPMPQTVGDILAGWKSTFYRYYRKDYEVWSPIKLPKRLQRPAPKGKRLLYCTPPTPSHRFVIKTSHPLPLGEGRVRDNQKGSNPHQAFAETGRPSPAAPAAASPEGRGNDAPLVKTTSHPLPSGEGRVRDSQKGSNPHQAFADTGRPSPAAPAAASPEGRGDDAPLVKHTPTPVGAIHESPLPPKTTPDEVLIHDDDVPPEVLARFQAQLIHVLEQIDPTELQARLTPEHWQLASALLSAKQERAG
jgi:hypothetical protein